MSELLESKRAEKFHLVAGQTHELALGARRAFQGIDNPEQTRKWLELPFLGIGISGQVKPLVDRRVLTAAVVSSLTMELVLRLLVRALDSQIRPPDRSVVDVSSYPALEKLYGKV